MSAIPHWKKLLDKTLEQFPRSNSKGSLNNVEKEIDADPSLLPRRSAFQLATIDTASPIPHVRSHIFRSFLQSGSTPDLPLLLSTTDIRTPKIDQIISNPNTEACWWIEGTQEQFRIAGRLSLVASPNHDLFTIARGQLLNNAKVDSEGGLAALMPAEYDWETKRIEAFKRMSAHMKASWCRPVPGSVLKGGQDEARKWPERVEEPGDDDSEEAKKNWMTALNNFALVIIEPIEIDYLTMAIIPNRRFKFARAVDGGWDEVEVVP